MTLNSAQLSRVDWTNICRISTIFARPSKEAFWGTDYCTDLLSFIGLEMMISFLALLSFVALYKKILQRRLTYVQNSFVTVSVQLLSWNVFVVDQEM